MSLEPFLSPKSIALVGVSRDMNKFNGIVLKNLLEIDYPGKIFLVNPHAEEILGIKCYPKIMDLPNTPELAIILHSNVVSILENCGKKGIKSVLIQADISLKDEEDQQRVRTKILEVTQKYDMQFIGPSLIGLMNFTSKFTSSIIPVRDHIARLGQDPDRAGIAFMAQSGGLSGACGWWNPTQNVSFSKIIHFREELPGAIKDEEFLEYLVKEDDTTRIIILFLRQVSDSLLEGVRKYSSEKPILFKKCGKPTRVQELLDAGAMQVDHYFDLFETAKAFIFSPLPKGNRIGLIGPSSGAIDLVLSEFSTHNLVVAKPSPDIREKIKNLLAGKGAKRCNPVDYWPPPRFFGHEVGKVHHAAADYLLSDEKVDAIFLVLEFFNEIEFDLMIFQDIIQKYPNKPIMGVLIQAEQDGASRVKQAATALSIPIYEEPERLVKAFSLLYRFSQLREVNNKDG